jgi:hypothetical protein
VYVCAYICISYEKQQIYTIFVIHIYVDKSICTYVFDQLFNFQIEFQLYVYTMDSFICQLLCNIQNGSMYYFPRCLYIWVGMY